MSSESGKPAHITTEPAVTFEARPDYQPALKRFVPAYKVTLTLPLDVGGAMPTDKDMADHLERYARIARGVAMAEADEANKYLNS